MKKVLYDYGDKYAGETIYILGSAPSLKDLTIEELKFLEDKTTIGANYTYEGINSLSYVISAHISPAVYLFEYTQKETHLFVAFNKGEKRQAFSYMEDFFWNDEKITIFSSDAPRLPLCRKKNKEDISLRGNTSVLLLATHLAYIMGAHQIVYIGFDERRNTHFWNGDEYLENKMQKNIRKILESKKYWSENYYHQSGMWAKAHNVHKEFEYLLGETPGFEGQFGDSREVGKSFWGGKNSNIPGLPPASENIKIFSQYVGFLNSKNIKTLTRSDGGVTIQSGCTQIETVI